MTTQKYQANWLVNHNGKDFTPNSKPLDLTDDEAKPLLLAGAISDFSSNKKAAKNETNA